MGVKINFSADPASGDPAETPVVVMGLLKNLQKVSFDRVRSKMEPRVDEETWKAGVGMLTPSPTDTIGLYMNVATVGALPNKCSRHNAPSRCHAIAKMAKSCSSGQSENFVVSFRI
jgi:probable aminopeptidase NPEPL1